MLRFPQNRSSQWSTKSPSPSPPAHVSKRRQHQISPHKSPFKEPHPHITLADRHKTKLPFSFLLYRSSTSVIPLSPKSHNTHQKINMAHHTTHRRILAYPDPSANPSSMDSTLKITHPTTKNPDHNFPSKPFYMSNPLSKLYPIHKLSSTTHKSTKNPSPTYVDTHLQAKAMTLSADFDGSRLSTIKTKHQPQKRVEIEKVKKSSSKGSAVVDKKKVQQVTVKEKKKEIHSNTVKDNKEVKEVFEGLDIKRMTVSLGGGRRRSFCGSQVELADFLAHNGAKIVSVDMPPFMQIHAVDCARKTHDSLEKFTSKTLALTLKKEFDAVYGPAWHCIVGTSFGSFVTHSVGGFLYFSMDQKLYVLLFKTTVQRAD